MFALVACNGKQAAPLTIHSIDRSCSVDADCTMTGDTSCCGTSCGRDFGDAVNAKAWAKAVGAIRARCKGEECAVMCQQLPDCRDEAVAVCKSGVCDRQMKKTAACDDLACETDDDCVRVSRGQNCCDHCGGKALNRAGAARAHAELEKTCANTIVKCPPLDCPVPPIGCVNKQCAVRQ